MIFPEFFGASGIVNVMAFMASETSRSSFGMSNSPFMLTFDTLMKFLPTMVTSVPGIGIVELIPVMAGFGPVGTNSMLASSV